MRFNGKYHIIHHKFIWDRFIVYTTPNYTNTQQYIVYAIGA